MIISILFRVALGVGAFQAIVDPIKTKGSPPNIAFVLAVRSLAITSGFRLPSATHLDGVSPILYRTLMSTPARKDCAFASRDNLRRVRPQPTIAIEKLKYTFPASKSNGSFEP